MKREALLGLVLLGWAMRLVPWLTTPLDYDEGVYYASAALWAEGVWPYRDFVMVHPPGLLYFLLPFSLFRPSVGLMLARLAITLVGAANVAMIALLAHRSFGRQAGYLAAFCYALYPEAVLTERRVLLEPLINFCVLAMLIHRGPVQIAWAGYAVIVKAWGLLWLLAGLPRLRHRALAAALLGLALCLPALLASPQGFVDGILLFQLGRPPHDSHGLVGRLFDVFDPRHLAITLLAVWGWRTGRSREPEVAGHVSRGWALLLLAMVMGKGHFFQYNAHLALPECFWAGAAWPLVRARPRLWAVLLCIPLGFSLAGWLKTDPGEAAAARVLRAPQKVFCFEPGLGLLADRLPDQDPPVIVDSYAVMLIDAGPGFADVPAAMADERSQTRVRQRLLASRCVLVDSRAREQLSQEWLRRHFRPQGDLWYAR